MNYFDKHYFFFSIRFIVEDNSDFMFKKSFKNVKIKLIQREPKNNVIFFCLFVLDCIT